LAAAAIVPKEPLNQQDYYEALARIVMATAQDSAQMREAIYELARKRLREQLSRQVETLSHSERAQQLAALEIAIERIENDVSHTLRGLTSSGTQGLAPRSGRSIEIIPPPNHCSRALHETIHDRVHASGTWHRPVLIRTMIVLITATIFAAILYVGVSGVFLEPFQSQSGADGNTRESATASPRHSPAPVVAALMPVPTTYGVYALSNDQLIELSKLPIKMPDERIAISGNISSPSTTNLTSGKVRFIVFTRDLVNNAPEKIMVRIVAKVKHASELHNNVRATTVDSASWIVRGNSYQMKVTPVPGNPAMILVRPAEPDFVFPAGRYALALKSAAYDFSVGGPVTDRAQCVERNDEGEYAECFDR
jgi:hypothetical protein